MGTAIDLFVTYRFIKLLVTPFNKTEAFKLGIIDDKGIRQVMPGTNVPTKLSTIKERNAYISILIGLFFGLLLFPSPDFSKSILIGFLFPISNFPVFMSQSLLFMSFLVATFSPILAWKIK